jgi:hypothetical protein
MKTALTIMETTHLSHKLNVVGSPCTPLMVPIKTNISGDVTTNKSKTFVLSRPIGKETCLVLQKRVVGW